jgi:hypothetical protein
MPSAPGRLFESPRVPTAAGIPGYIPQMVPIDSSFFIVRVQKQGQAVFRIGAIRAYMASLAATVFPNRLNWIRFSGV